MYTEVKISWSLRKHAVKIIKKNEVINKQTAGIRKAENAKFCCICKEKFEDEYAEDKIIL